MILIIAEKSSQGQDILTALGRPGTAGRMQNGVGWGMVDAGTRLCVAATEGHAFELFEPHEYRDDWRATTVEQLPLVPADFAFRLRCTFTARIQMIQRLANDAVEIVNCCDAGREGEGIFHELAQELGWLKSKRKLSRMWMSSLSPTAIQGAFRAREDDRDKKYRHLAAAAFIRRELDWIYGISGSRCVSHFLQRTDGKKAHALGRVQTPVMKLIYDKSMARRQFKPINFYQVYLKFHCDQGDFTATLINNPEECVGENTTMLKDPVRAAELRTQICIEALEWLCIDDISEKLEAPPPPFNLVELQRSCSRLYHWSGRRTEQAARRCYREHKAITYPGTESELLPESMFDEAAKTFLWCFDQYRQTGRSMLEEEHAIFDRSYIVPDEKIEHDHHAIMPLRCRPPNSDADACIVWDLVVKRFLTAMSPAATIQACSRRLVVDTGKEQYSAFCDEGVVIHPGWLMMEDFVGNTRGYGLTLRDRLSRTWVTVNSPTVSLSGASVHEGATTPPELHSYDSLLGHMRVKRLGTAATRGEIIEGLVDHGYVHPIDGFLDISPEGARYCAALMRRAPRTVTVELAEKTEGDIEKIEKGKRGASTRESLLTMVAEEVRMMVRIFVANEAHECGPVCPFSGDPIEDRGSFWYFPGLPKVTFPKKYSSRQMEPSDWLEVVSAPPHKGAFLKGFRTGDGRDFSAFLSFNPKARGKRFFRFRRG